MTKNRFNESEEFLIRRWSEVRLLEESAATIRAKFKRIEEQVCEAVQEDHAELDRIGVHPTLYGGHIGIGKKQWPSKWDKWPSGLWVGDISLENLCSEEKDAPHAAIWIKPPKRIRFDYADTKARLLAEAKKVFSRDQRGRLLDDNNGYTCFYYHLPESRQELLGMLLKDEARPFIECLTAHFEELAKFIPIIDGVFPNGAMHEFPLVWFLQVGPHRPTLRSAPDRLPAHAP